jgi:hypothetical protein
MTRRGGMAGCRRCGILERNKFDLNSGALMKLRKLATGLALVVAGAVLTLGHFRLWIATYPDAGDPKNLSYVLWKHGLNSDIDLDMALGTMTHDVASENRVIGLTPTELQARFGYTKTYEQVSTYLQLCDTPNGTGDHDNHSVVHDILYLRNSNYMVMMKNGRAADLILCKGY